MSTATFWVICNDIPSPTGTPFRRYMSPALKTAYHIDNARHFETFAEACSQYVALGLKTSKIVKVTRKAKPGKFIIRKIRCQEYDSREAAERVARDYAGGLQAWKVVRKREPKPADAMNKAWEKAANAASARGEAA